MLVLVRHAEAELRVVGGPSEDERPLTPLGAQQAVELVDNLVGYQPTAVVSSPYRRAVDTVGPTARVLGLEVATRVDLREWDDGLETVEDWLPLYERCWQDSDHRYGAGETHRELATRAGAAIRDLLDQARAGPLIAASHGNWIARGLEAIGAPVSRRFWQAMPNPAVYLITEAGATVTVSGPGFPARRSGV